MSWYGRVGQQIYYEGTGRGDTVLLLSGWGGSFVELSRLRRRRRDALLMATLDPGRALSVVTWGAAGQVVAAPEALDAIARVVDDPIEPLEPLAAYLVEAYGADEARFMAESWAEALRAIVDSGGDISRSRATLVTAQPF